MNRAVVYARYSSSSQNEQSIDTQIDLCTEYAKKNDLVVVNSYIDRGMTGTNTKRPGFQKMIADSFNDEFEYVIVYKLDRFARDEYDDMYYERVLLDNGVKRLSATEPIPEDHFSASLVKAITRISNEQYSRLLSQRVTHGLNKNVELGMMVGGSVTFGYDMINKKYQINETRATYIRMMFDMYVNGSTIKEICTELTSKGIYNINNKPFQFQHISKILHNKRYIGIFKYKGVEYPDFIPKIIDEQTFKTVQGKLGKNATKKSRVRYNVKYNLTGKLFCGYCGHPMTGLSGTGRHGGKHYYYKCYNSSCDKKNEIKDYLENLVVKYAVEQIVKSDKLDMWIHSSIEVYNNQFQKNDVIIKNIQNQIAKTNNEMDNIMNAIKAGFYSNRTKIEFDTLEERLNGLELELIKMRAEKPETLDYDMLKFWFNKFLTKDPDEDDKADIIGVLVNKVIKYDDRLVIAFNISDDNTYKYETGVCIDSPDAHQHK